MTPDSSKLSCVITYIVGGRPAHNRAKDKRYFSYFVKERLSIYRAIVKVCQIDGIKISWNQNFRIVKFMFSKKATKIYFVKFCGLLRKHELYKEEDAIEVQIYYSFNNRWPNDDHEVGLG